MSNTDAADINEIQLGWYLSDNWAKFKSSTEAKKQLKTKLAKVGQAVYDDQTAKAEAMSKEILKWSILQLNEKRLQRDLSQIHND